MRKINFKYFIIGLILILLIGYFLIAFSIVIYNIVFKDYTYKFRGLLDIFSVLSIFTVPIYILFIFNSLKLKRKNEFNFNLLLNKWFGNWFDKNTKIKISILTIITILGVINFIWSNYFGSTQIGDFYEKKEYSAKYYVYLTEDKNQSKRYKLVAEIEKGFLGQYKDYLDKNGDWETGFVSNYNGYILYKIYFNNGGYLSFDREEADEQFYDCVENIIYPHRETRVVTTHGKTYFVELTKEKVN